MPVHSDYKNGCMFIVDLNCDMGEGMGNDELIMPHISSVNIACAYHAGNVKTIWQTIESAITHHVSIGAHPSFADRQNFGRTEIILSPPEIYDLVIQQLLLINEIAISLDQRLHHIKPHGALYNMSAKDSATAKAIANATRDFDQQLILFGLSGSCSIDEARSIGLRTCSEVFADRTYQDDGTLTPRSQPGALIDDPEQAIIQVIQMIKEGTVRTSSGNDINIVAETICIHGDGKNAALFAKNISQKLKENNIVIKAK